MLLTRATVHLSLIAASASAASIFDITPAQWQALNSSVGGRLQAGRPINLPCFSRYSNGSSTPGSNAPDASACAAAQNGKADGAFISNHFGGYHSPNVQQCVPTGQDCAISAFLPVDPLSPLLRTCFQGTVPSYYVDCHSAADVQAGLAFVNNYSVPLVIKNTGHDYRARSTGQNTFALWTHNIQPPLQFSENFTPSGCSASAGPALTFGAGAQFQQLNDFAHSQGHFMVAGASPSVGASGGWVTGGGHSALTTSYGLGVDNVLEMKAVLANGQIVTANRCQNTDLFFALRGGGGGTFAVILETTSKLYKIVPMQSTSIVFAHLGVDQGSTFHKILLDNAEKWAAEGWGGYVLPGALQGTAATMNILTPKLTLAEAKDSMQPVVDFALSLGNVPVTINITTLPNGYHDYIQQPMSELIGGFLGTGAILVSRLVPRQNFQTESSKQQLVETFKTLNRNSQPNPVVPFYVLFIPPAAYELPSTDLPGGPGYASVTPAWRDSLWHIVMPSIWDPADPTASGAGSVTQAYKDAHQAIDPLRQITPNSGAYLNEADIFEDNYPATFWGQDNYDRLLSIKQQVDPKNIFTCFGCIGWDSSDERYGCYPQGV